MKSTVHADDDDDDDDDDDGDDDSGDDDDDDDDDGRPDEDKSTAHAESSLNEVCRLLKEVGDWRGGQVLADKALVADSLLCKLCWVHPHILLGAVDNMSYPK